MSSIAEYYALRPGDYGPIVCLEFSQYKVPEAADGVVEHELKLVLSRSPDLSGDRFVLCFRGVSELRFEQPSWTLAVFGLIELHERESGFRATEEEGIVTFGFRSFDVHLEVAENKPAR
jgi:hypothetical protein